MKLFKNTKMKLYRSYVNTRNFFINNFFVEIYCFKCDNKCIYLNNYYLIYKYLLLLIPFYFIKTIANIYKYDIIYKVDGIYGITNIKENHIIPFITSCIVISDKSSLNISSYIRYYNSSIPLCFFIDNNNINNYNTIELVYFNKAVKIEKKVNLKTIDTTKYLIYNLFQSN
jgi:hypothetical protein